MIDFCAFCSLSLPSSAVARWNRWFCDQLCADAWRKGSR